MQAVDGIAPYREFRVKRHTEYWFDGEMDKSKSRQTSKKVQKVKIRSLPPNL